MASRMDAPRVLDRYKPGRPHWWQWLTVLSLDAPLVAMAWQAALAQAMRAKLDWHHVFILGASVWLAYAADRWIEGWRLAAEQVRTQRHWFYRQWRWPVAGVWAGVLLAAVTISVQHLTEQEFLTGLIVLAPVLIYLLSHQLIHRESRWRVPKEVCVALLFAGGVVCFPAAQRPTRLPDIAVPLTLFGLLCFADCALISLWEDEVDREHGQTSLALQFPHTRPFVRALPWITAALAAAFASHANPVVRVTGWCAAASGGLLGVIDLTHRRLGRQLARGLVDLTLLTPLVPLLWSRLATP